MPAQKRAWSENLHADDEEDSPSRHHQFHRKQPRHERELTDEEEEEGEDEEEEEEEEGEEEEEEEQEEEEGEEEAEAKEEEAEEEEQDDDDSDGSPSSSSEEQPEFVYVELPNIRKDVQCPICLGIIKKTRTVMECLHRFCRECIDKSMRLGNNECPACRTHCASRRSLRDDPNYDALIAALYPDIEKYEEEELAFHEEEKNRNKQIQASIAQVFQRQEALVKRRSMVKDPTNSFITRSQRNYRNARSRRRRSGRSSELQGSDDNDDENDNDGGKDSSSTDDRYTEVKQRRGRRRAGIRHYQTPLSAASSDGGCIENDLEVSRESRGISPGLVWSAEMLAWGGGGTRSHTRHGSGSGCNNRNARNARLSKLIDYLRSMDGNDDELDVHLMLLSLDKQSTPSLQQPYLCCRPSLSVRRLREYVALHTPLQAEEVEILVVNGCINENQLISPIPNPSTSLNYLDAMPEVVDPCKSEVRILDGQETLAGLKASCIPSRDYLILAYRLKETLTSS
ncbi:putative E3 ubiquitin-protein ligase RING1a isoform X2 [Malania oleifera]|uniref:putative E3 ubiquitin-protein ligase RING1a isoform X2 n=1 Tax=Malania oleifera TaxID=397392 RepID=UPI0025ADAC6B|nr:putative E3 ubiquitin-protein ligase RING1a isoform X2 [Malania oleifera]